MLIEPWGRLSGFCLGAVVVFVRKKDDERRFWLNRLIQAHFCPEGLSFAKKNTQETVMGMAQYREASPYG